MKKDSKNKQKLLTKAEIVRRIIAANPQGITPAAVRLEARIAYGVEVPMDTVNRLLYKTPVKYKNRSGVIYNTIARGKNPMSLIGRKAEP